MIFRGHSETVRSLAFHPTRPTLASTSQDGTVRLWQVGDRILVGPHQVVGAVAFSRDGKLLVGTGLGTCRLWSTIDPQHPEPTSILRGHTDGVLSAEFSPDGCLLATSSLDGTMRLWSLADVHNPTPVGNVRADPENVFAVSLSPDGRTAATGGANQKIQLWDITEPRYPTPIFEPLSQSDRILDLSFSPDGSYLAAAAGEIVTLWRIGDDRHCERVGAIQGHDSRVTGVVFSRDRHILATSSADQTVKLWDYRRHKSGQPLSSLSTPTVLETLAISPDNQTLAAAGHDGAIRLWTIIDPRRPALFATLNGHSDGVNSVVFHPSLPFLASAGSDGSVRLWMLDPVAVSQWIRSTANPPLTNDELTAYFASH